jgi:AAA15 family ATPase/GTPase
LSPKGVFQMLIEFTFKNAYSYKNETYFSMEAAKGTKKVNEFPTYHKHRILKTAMIFGSNASGKSNFFNALDTFKRIVLKPEKLNGLPFPSFAGTQKEPISLSVTFLKETVIYRYSIVYNPKKIVSEKLECEENGEFVTYFQRENGQYLVLPDDLKPFTAKTRPEALFLNTAKTFNDTHSLNVFRWFIQDVLMIGIDNKLNQEMLKSLQNKKKKENILKFMRAADINIQDVEVIEQKSPIPADIKFDFPETEIHLWLKHKQYDENGNKIEDFVLNLSEESKGTKKLLHLALIILLNKNKTILIDEFDNSFHFELAKAMLEVFNSDENSNQFILTSHELALMDLAFKKEQIYFVERKDNGESDLYSAYDFATETNRKDYSYLKRYLAGQFGATPIILVDALKETLKEVQ